jgi:uncharacterized protein (TIGR02594 family)
MIPAWLEIARRCIGICEEPGTANSPQIMRGPEIIAAAYPEMEDYCACYTADSIAWCGLAVAFFVTSAGFRPVYGKDDTHRFLWAAAWKDWGDKLSEPKPGAIIVLDHHVALYERTEGLNVVLLGGNQSDKIKESSFASSGILAIRWPTGG